ncbi:MAG: hypothetical protein ACLFQB_02095 [Chitinispirillaceae bacterium]
MSGVKTGMAVAVPVVVLGVAGVVMRKMAGHDGKALTEQIRQATRETVHDLEGTVSDFRKNLEGKSASQLQKSIDSITDNTKSRIDRIANQLKNRIRVEQMKSRARS